MGVSVSVDQGQQIIIKRIARNEAKAPRNKQVYSRVKNEARDTSAKGEGFVKEWARATSISIYKKHDNREKRRNNGEHDMTGCAKPVKGALRIEENGINLGNPQVTKIQRRNKNNEKSNLSRNKNARIIVQDLISTSITSPRHSPSSWRRPITVHDSTSPRIHCAHACAHFKLVLHRWTEVEVGGGGIVFPTISFILVHKNNSSMEGEWTKPQYRSLHCLVMIKNLQKLERRRAVGNFKLQYFGTDRDVVVGAGCSRQV